MEMSNMIEIRWHGRGGQGAKTASLLLADAAFNTGKYIQGFPEYGPERMGAPITAYNRISDEPITIHSNIYYPDYVVVVDDTLLESVDVTAGLKEEGAILDVYFLHKKPYAMFECKRVGVEEGNKKGPQTIEKAKQGAYVAKTTSSLQKIRRGDGELYGIIYDKDKPIIKPYNELLHEVIEGESTKLLTNFTLSVGIVSNHGNWFTSENMNKELKVLAQSYDWLIFLSDKGLAQFITDLLLTPQPQYKAIQDAFLESYTEGKKSNVFTKAKMKYEAHLALMSYFHENVMLIEDWFNIIAPQKETIGTLKKELATLAQKNWREIV